MMKLSCDAHTWMRAYIGVVNHPYFAVTGSGGTFEIANVPAGSQTIRVWHEQYGQLQKTVLVKPGSASTVDFSFVAAQPPPSAESDKQPARRRSAR